MWLFLVKSASSVCVFSAKYLFIMNGKTASAWVAKLKLSDKHNDVQLAQPQEFFSRHCSVNRLWRTYSMHFPSNRKVTRINVIWLVITELMKDFQGWAVDFPECCIARGNIICCYTNSIYKTTLSSQYLVLLFTLKNKTNKKFQSVWRKLSVFIGMRNLHLLHCWGQRIRYLQGLLAMIILCGLSPVPVCLHGLPR